MLSRVAMTGAVVGAFTALAGCGPAEQVPVEEAVTDHANACVVTPAEIEDAIGFSFEAGTDLTLERGFAACEYASGTSVRLELVGWEGAVNIGAELEDPNSLHPFPLEVEGADGSYAKLGGNIVHFSHQGIAYTLTLSGTETGPGSERMGQLAATIIDRIDAAQELAR